MRNAGTRKLPPRPTFTSGIPEQSPRSNALKPLYKDLRAKGFATTEAFVILGRKLLRAAFAVWKTGQQWEPARLLPKSV